MGKRYDHLTAEDRTLIARLHEDKIPRHGDRGAAGPPQIDDPSGAAAQSNRRWPMAAWLFRDGGAPDQRHAPSPLCQAASRPGLGGPRHRPPQGRLVSATGHFPMRADREIPPSVPGPAPPCRRSTSESGALLGVCPEAGAAAAKARTASPRAAPLAVTILRPGGGTRRSPDAPSRRAGRSAAMRN